MKKEKNDFLKSIWFPIVLFILLELIFAISSYLIAKNTEGLISCFPSENSRCQQGTYSDKSGLFNTLIIGLIPSALISLITYFLIRKYKT